MARRGADCFNDMLGEWERQLAGAAAEVEKSAGSVEVELGISRRRCALRRGLQPC
jgi:hypothetical protein